MKYHSVKSLCAAFALLLLFHAAGFSAVPQKPVPARSVNDFAGIFTAGQSSAIESELSDFAKRTSNQFVVVTVPDLYGMDKADLAYSIGEEWGFAGSLFIILLYIYLIRRIVLLSSRSRNKFTEIYGYCVAAIIFMHFFINIGMTIGLVPVIGIPLPFISYGGTSLLSFTALLFIFIRLESDSRKQS